uniref:Uncharacterized protein n=1 Tax=Rhizophagus irregularis (strain DAOM 181602 / DAOM 197198 / MUCL 43194) TaxID=747089 RepID=U9UY14_RHIID
MEQEPYILKVPTDVFELKIVINMSDFERKLLAQDNVLAANAKMISEDSTKYLRGNYFLTSNDDE